MAWHDYVAPPVAETLESVKTERDMLRQWIKELRDYQSDVIDLKAAIADLRIAISTIGH